MSLYGYLKDIFPVERKILPDSILVIVDVQKEFTDEDRYLAKALFKGEVSASQNFIDYLEAEVIRLQSQGLLDIIAVKLVHDLEKMKKIDRPRFDNQLAKGLIQDGHPIICKPYTAGVELSFSKKFPKSIKSFEKCTRSILNEKSIVDYIERRNSIVLAGIDANVCIYESAKDLLQNSEAQVTIALDLVSTRPSEYRDTLEKFRELESLGCHFSTAESWE